LEVMEAKPESTHNGHSSVAIPGLTLTVVLITFGVVDVRGDPELVDDLGKIHRPRRGVPFIFAMQLASTFSD
jgi:hypothetical protein